MGGFSSKSKICGSAAKKASPILVNVRTSEACRFMRECLESVGANSMAAEQQARVLLQSDIYGHPSHGMNRIEMYVNDILKGVCQPNNVPVILKQSMSTAWIDAKNVLGATSSHLAMDVAIEKAMRTGVGWVTVKGANHNGCANYWAQLAADLGYIGLSFTNTAPVCAPTRSKEAALGTNPICMVAPASNGECFLLDIATTAVAFGQIEMQLQKGEKLPPGWAQGADGKMTQDAKEAYAVQCLYPLGGEEKTSGYKGFGLCAMVEILCGICAGSKYGHHIPDWPELGKCEHADLGHCFIVVNPNSFAPGFGERLTDIILHWRSLPPIDPAFPVLVPGDKERMAACLTGKTGTVAYLQQQIDAFAALAERIKVKPINISQADKSPISCVS